MPSPSELQRHDEDLRQQLDAACDALQSLVDVQDGPPSMAPRQLRRWNDAIAAAQRVLAEWRKGWKQS